MWNLRADYMPAIHPNFKLIYGFLRTEICDAGGFPGIQWR